MAELGPLREIRCPVLADAFLGRRSALRRADAAEAGRPGTAAQAPPVATLDEILADPDESRRDR